MLRYRSDKTVWASDMVSRSCLLQDLMCGEGARTVCATCAVNIRSRPPRLRLGYFLSQVSMDLPMYTYTRARWPAIWTKYLLVSIVLSPIFPKVGAAATHLVTKRCLKGAKEGVGSVEISLVSLCRTCVWLS